MSKEEKAIEHVEERIGGVSFPEHSSVF